MTTERRRPAKLPAWPVAAGTAGTFLAALAFLAGQVRDGRDAALGPAEPVAAKQPQEVVVRRIIRRVVITEPAPRAAAPAAGGTAPASGGAAPAPSAPAPSAPAPAASAPAPAPAAPAPAPAPLTTRSS
jgi:hypothetical protein